MRREVRRAQHREQEKTGQHAPDRARCAGVAERSEGADEPGLGLCPGVVDFSIVLLFSPSARTLLLVAAPSPHRETRTRTRRRSRRFVAASARHVMDCHTAVPHSDVQASALPFRWMDAAPLPPCRDRCGSSAVAAATPTTGRQQPRHPFAIVQGRHRARRQQRGQRRHRRRPRTAQRISSGSVCRHLKMAGRIAFFTICSGLPAAAGQSRNAAKASTFNALQSLPGLVGFEEMWQIF